MGSRACLPQTHQNGRCAVVPKHERFPRHFTPRPAPGHLSIEGETPPHEKELSSQTTEDHTFASCVPVQAGRSNVAIAW
jgi:hypothetical protein